MNSASTLNAYQQPIGLSLPEWTPRPMPSRMVFEGRFCRLEPLDPQRHVTDLYKAYSQAQDGRDWTYMMAGPFASEQEYREYAQRIAAGTDPLHFAVIDVHAGVAVGTLSLMRIDAANGAIEVGNVAFSPLLKRTPASTEAQFLLMKYAFDELGYRRYEWKCDSLNGPSRQAAARLGFQFEGVFRQAVIYKERTRDTAWFSIIDSEWPALRTAFETWLAADNFNADGSQRASLQALRQGGGRFA